MDGWHSWAAEWNGVDTLSEFLLAACGTDCLLNRSYDTNHLACAVKLRIEGPP